MIVSSLALALAAAAPHAALPWPMHHASLPNGLQVLFVRQDAPGLAAFFTFFRVGSRDEVEAGRSGFAHFFEHLTYRGTTTRSGEDWERITKSLGLEGNAFTGDDVTAYWSYGPSAALPRLVELEADRFRNLAYSEDDFKIEAGAVLGELLKSVDDPEFRMEEALRDLAFTRHPYRHTTIGYERDVRDMASGYRASLELYRRFYRPENAFVLVVGDFDEDATMEAIRRHFGPWPRGASSPAPPAEPAQAGERERRLTWPAPVLPRLWSAWRTPGAADVDATSVQMVLWPYLFGPSSALHRELVLERHLVERIDGDFEPHRDPFLFACELALEGPAAEAPARAAVDHALLALSRGEVDERLLDDVKSHIRSAVVMDTETPYRTGAWLLSATALTGDPRLVEALLERVARVRPEELSAFARRWLVPAGRSTVFLAEAPRAAAAPAGRTP